MVVRGRVVDWIEDESRWELIDRIALPYLGGPYPRDLDRIVMIIEPEQQLVGVR